MHQQCLFRILCDTIQAHSDVAYLFSETHQNQDLCFQAALGASKRGELIAISAAIEGTGYPGFVAWCSSLHILGVKRDSIIAIEPDSRETPDNVLNTYSEAAGLVSVACVQGWRALRVIAPPFHLPRAFISVVSVVLKRNLNLSIFAVSTPPGSWDESVAHSQGVVHGMRAELIKSEMKRIQRYRKTGHLVSDHDILDYMRHREMPQ